MKKLKHFLACAAMAVGLALCGMAGSGAAGVGMPVMAAETPDLSGTAYAVLDSSGTLWFVRSTETFTNGTKGTVKSISGGTYTGTIYTGFEEATTFNPSSYWNPSSGVNDNVKKVNFVDNIKPRATNEWFYHQNSLTEVDNTDKLIMSNATSTSCMFEHCSGLITFDASGLDTSNVKNMSYMFYGCSKLTSLDLSNFDTSKVTNMGGMFNGCRKLTSLDLSKFDTSKVTDMRYMFVNCSSLTSLDVSNFNTSKVTNMTYMFCGCSGLTSLDVSNFDTSKVTNMTYMFADCSGLTKLDASKWNTENVMYIYSMFSGCSGLTSLDVSNFDTSNVTDMAYMFNGCSGLTSLDVSNFDTSNVTDMAYMFADCSGLTKLDASKWNTENVMYIDNMFSGCSGLTSLDLSGWNTSKVAIMDSTEEIEEEIEAEDGHGFVEIPEELPCGMFYGCSKLSRIYTPEVQGTASAVLPAKFYLADSDGYANTNSVSYTNLKDAPASAMIVRNSFVPLTKYLLFDSAIPSETFKFSIAPAKAHSATDTTLAIFSGNADSVTGVPVIDEKGITFGYGDSTAGSDTIQTGSGSIDIAGKNYIKKTEAIDFSGVTFTEPGVYRYIITEKDDGAAGVSYDPDKYRPADAEPLTRYLDVYVTSDDDGVCSISKFVMLSSDSDIKINATSGSDSYVSTEKVDGFVNEYNSHNLTITKKVTGNQGSKDKYFRITVKITGAAPNSTIPLDYTKADASTGSNAATLDAYEGLAQQTKIETDAKGTGSAEIYLRNGQSVGILGLTEGADFTVTEDEEDYKPSIVLVDASNTEIAESDTDTISGTMKEDCEAVLTNDKSGTVPTGVIVTMAPYLIAAAIAGAVIVVVIINKKKQR